MNDSPHQSSSDSHHARLGIEYDGTHLAGWARQPNAPTVESRLREAFAAITCTDVDIRVAGRTDSGVHARAQVASIEYQGPVEPARLAAALNQQLPDDIAISASSQCSPQFDARRDALARAYEYRVLARRWPSPGRRLVTFHHPRSLDLSLLDAAAAAVVGSHDFTAFTPSDTLHTHFVRDVSVSSWERVGDELVYSIRADAFLRHMVRVLVGSMLAVGRGEWDLDRFTALLEGAPRADGHQTAPALGLCLVDVEYPEVIAHTNDLQAAAVGSVSDINDKLDLT